MVARPRLKSLSGRDIGRVAKRVYVCETCGQWHYEKPRYCRNCGDPVIHFATKAEATVYARLKLLERAGKITALQIQPLKTLHAPGVLKHHVKIGTWRADFEYIDEHGARVVVDVKAGADTPLSRWKRRHFEIQTGIEVQIAS